MTKSKQGHTREGIEGATKQKGGTSVKPKTLSLLDIVQNKSTQPLLPPIPSNEDAFVYPVATFPPLTSFDVSFTAPALIIPTKRTNELLKKLHSIILRRPRCKIVTEVTANNQNLLPVVDGQELSPKQCRKLILNPGLIKIKVSTQTDNNIDIHPLLTPLLSSHQACLEECTMNFTYSDWTTDEIFKRLLQPHGIDEIPSAFEVIGNLAHLNLRPQLLPYQYLLGKVLLDKHQPTIRTVVNKVGSIETQFRTFNMQVIAGYDGPDWNLVEVKEEGCTYQLDFKRVYWNSRLAGEHRRLVRLIRKHQLKMEKGTLVVADMMAGIGPFAVPLTASGSHSSNCNISVHANDLNPASYHYLVMNGRKNNCQQRLHTYNMDARAFCHQLQDRGICVHHFIMNLPASGLDFLDAFRGYKVRSTVPMEDEDETIDVQYLPTIHVHCFASKDKERAYQTIYDRAGKALGCELDTSKVTIAEVRDVAPQKNMYCVSFQLPAAVLMLNRIPPEEGNNANLLQPKIKRQKT
jgi:tRNA (guanine37-N1)-methyltransferase